MPISTRPNIRNILANPTSTEDVAKKPMWLKLIRLDPANLDDIESAKAKVVLCGTSGDSATENMLNFLSETYDDLDAGRKSFLDFCFIDKSENPSCTVIHGINKFPTLLFFIFGMQIKKVTGEISNDTFQNYLEDFFKKSDWIANRIDTIEWTGTNPTLTDGIFEIKSTDVLEWTGTNPTLTDGIFEIMLA